MVSPILCSSRISVLISTQPDRTDTFPLKLHLSGLLFAVYNTFKLTVAINQGMDVSDYSDRTEIIVQNL